MYQYTDLVHDIRTRQKHLKKLTRFYTVMLFLTLTCLASLVWRLHYYHGDVVPTTAILVTTVLLTAITTICGSHYEVNKCKLDQLLSTYTRFYNHGEA